MLLERLNRWNEKTTEEKRFAVRTKLQTLSGLLFRAGFARLGSISLSYLPDSQAIFGAHPEFGTLWKSFAANNPNNAGDISRLWSFVLNIKQVLAEGVDGDFAELGVWRGNTASILAKLSADTGRKVFLFDTFEGFSPKDFSGLDADKKQLFQDTSLDMVKRIVGIDASHCSYVKGYFPDSITSEHQERSYAVVSLDCDLYEPMKAALEFFYPRMPVGGLLLLHDYSSLYWRGAKQAIDEFCARTQEHLVLLPDKSGSACVRRTLK